MLHLYIFSNSPSSIASDIPTWEGAPHLLMEIVSRLSCILQLTMVLSPAILPFSLSKFRSTAFQNTVDNCGNILMTQHLNVCLYQQRYTFFFFFGLEFAVEQSFLVELCHAQPAQGNSSSETTKSIHVRRPLLNLASSWWIPVSFSAGEVLMIGRVDFIS